MLALSTSCLDPTPGDLEGRLALLLDQDVGAVELDARIAGDEIEEAGRVLAASRRAVVCLHAPSPGVRMPRGAGTPGDRRGDDPLPLTAEDEVLRERGVQAVLDTLEWAARLEADTVIVRAGHTPIELPVDRIRALRAERTWPVGEGETILRKIERDRTATAPRCLDRLWRGLDVILESASDLGVTVALVNRSCPHEIPNVPECALILEKFAGAPLGTWFDIAHAYRQESLALEVPGATLAAFEPALRGVHAHDVRDLEGGLPPGEGEIPWRDVLGSLSPGLPVVFRPRAGLTPERIAAGIERLRHGLVGDENTPTDPFFP